MSWSPDPAVERWLADIANAVSPLVRDAETRIGRIRQMREEPPRLVLAGTYNTGKSSLLKRLCVDEGIPVPEGLVIQGEPSTATIESARIGQWLMIDTPGLDAPQPEHVRAALGAAREADRVLLFVNPDLFSESSPTAALLNELEAGSAAIVVSRIDKAVMSPTELEAWSATKRTELEARAKRLGHDGLEIFAVAPDARGLVRNSDADAARYDRSRAWDGVAELRRWMEQPPAESERDRALERRAKLILAEARLRLDEMQEANRGERAVLEKAIESIARQVERVNAVEADVRQSLVAATQEAARSGPSASARSRITVAADRELDRIRRVARSLVGDLEVDEPPWTVDLAFALQVPSTPEDGADETPDVDLEGVEEAIREQMNQHAGDPARQKQLEEDLRAWREAKRRGKTREHYADGDTAFDRLGDAREAERELSELRRRDFAVRVGEVALNAWREERNLRNQLADRERVAEIARDRAVELAARMTAALHDAPGGVAEVFATIRAELADRRVAKRDRLASLAKEVQPLERIAASIDSLYSRR